MRIQADDSRHLDVRGDIPTRLRCEWYHAPYRSADIEAQEVASAGFGKQAKCCIVYIRRFTTNGFDFAYRVQGRMNLTKFFSGTHGALLYDGPIYASLIVLNGKDMHIDDRKVVPISWTRLTRVHKNGAKPDKDRWRYLFETARLAWGKMRFDADALQKLKTTRADCLKQEDVDELDTHTEAWGEGAVSASCTTSPEAQRTAIQQTLESLKRRERNCNTILEFLTNELYGRRKRQRQSDLTDKQHRLVAKLVDTADSLDDVYAMLDDPKNEGVKGENTYVEQEVQLDSERDDLIRQFQEELGRPIDAVDDVEPPKLNELNQPCVPGYPDKPEDSTGPRDSNASEDSNALSQEQLDAITSFINHTGADFEDAHIFLLESFWDLSSAVSQFYYDQDDANRPASPDVDLEAALQTSLQDLPGSQDPSSTYGPSRGAEPFGDDFYDAVDSAANILTRMGEQTSSAGPLSGTSTISDKPTNHASVRSNDANKRQALSSSDPRAAMRTRMEEIAGAELQAGKVSDKQLEKIYSSAGTSCHDDHIKSGVVGETKKPGTAEETNSEFADMTKPNATKKNKADATEDSQTKPAKITRRTGISHTGECIFLDSENQCVAHATPPQGTPWKQFQAMRRRLQLQYYGHEAATSNPDPHRGMPTKEKCPPESETQPDDEASEDIPSATTVSDPAAAIREEVALIDRIATLGGDIAARDAAEIAMVRAVVDAADAQEALEIAEAADAADALATIAAAEAADLECCAHFEHMPRHHPSIESPSPRDDEEKEEFATDFFANMLEMEGEELRRQTREAKDGLPAPQILGAKEGEGYEDGWLENESGGEDRSDVGDEHDDMEMGGIVEEDDEQLIIKTEKHEDVEAEGEADDEHRILKVGEGDVDAQGEGEGEQQTLKADEDGQDGTPP